MKKGLIRHVLQSPALLAALPESAMPLKADSIRFRSLAFASTVFGRKESGLNADGNEAAEDAGGHGRKRAKEWRENEDTDERGVMGGYRQKEKAPELSNRKTALTDGQKRRVAFIKGELNEGKKACNAYLVIEPLPATCHLSMSDVIKVLVHVTNGSSFEGFTLRADHVRPRSSAAILAAAQMASKPATTASLAPSTAGTAYSVPATEARRTLFVGGLDFAESEENIRAATEIILVKQRGPSGEKGWVEGVRMIRDASTGLGKGFGYVLMRVSEISSFLHRKRHSIEN
jgi:nucleolar protein 12